MKCEANGLASGQNDIKSKLRNWIIVRRLRCRFDCSVKIWTMKENIVPSVWQVLISVPDSLTETLLMVCRQCARRRTNIFISLKLDTRAVEPMPLPNELNEIGKKVK